MTFILSFGGRHHKNKERMKYMHEMKEQRERISHKNKHDRMLKMGEHSFIENKATP